MQGDEEGWKAQAIHSSPFPKAQGWNRTSEDGPARREGELHRAYPWRWHRHLAWQAAQLSLSLWYVRQNEVVSIPPIVFTQILYAIDK